MKLDRVAIFTRDSGWRGLEALESCSEGGIVLREQPDLWFNLGEDVLGLGLVWGLTRNIMIKLPHFVPNLQADLRETFCPELDSSDKKKIVRISAESQYPEAIVRKIYNLVCTYNMISQFQQVQGKTIVKGARVSISPKLGYANHSCEPNATRLDVTSLSDFQSKWDGLKAIRDIQASEEVTWSYFYGEIPDKVKDRQQFLRKNFGFDCKCQRCLREA